MFRDIDLVYVLFPAFLIGMIILIIIHLRLQKKDISDNHKNIEHFKISIIVFGGLLLILMMALPQPFDTPTAEELAGESNQNLLKFIAKQSKMTARITEVLYYFLFFFIWMFLSMLHRVIKATKNPEQTS